MCTWWGLAELTIHEPHMAHTQQFVTAVPPMASTAHYYAMAKALHEAFTSTLKGYAHLSRH